jgi:Fic family protein
MPGTAQRRSMARLDDLVVRIRGEYREMPGLSLTIAQAQRLWGLEPSTCQTVFEHLVEARILRRTRHGRFVRCDSPGGYPRATRE